MLHTKYHFISIDLCINSLVYSKSTLSGDMNVHSTKTCGAVPSTNTVAMMVKAVKKMRHSLNSDGNKRH